MEASALGSRGQEDADGLMVFINGWWEALPFTVPVAVVATQCRQIVCDTFDAARIGIIDDICGSRAGPSSSRDPLAARASRNTTSV